jgi:hypothetical protein
MPSVDPNPKKKGKYLGLHIQKKEKLALDLALYDGQNNLESSDGNNGRNEMIMNDIEDKARELKSILAKNYAFCIAMVYPGVCALEKDFVGKSGLGITTRVIALLVFTC